MEIRAHNPVERCMLIPAVAEPQVIWQISGTVQCEDRELGGVWNPHRVAPGELFLTTSPDPYELRWKSLGSEPIVVMHAYVGLPLLARVAKELWGEDAEVPHLTEMSGFRDPTVSGFLEQLRLELTERGLPNKLFVQGIAQSLAVHLLRTYRDEHHPRPLRPSALPAFQFRKVAQIMQEAMEEGVNIGKLAEAVDMSESHFSRLFKGTTGLSPSQYFIRLRMTRAQELLRETKNSIIEIGLDVGYTSASHFAHVFRKEVGLTPMQYRRTNSG